MSGMNKARKRVWSDFRIRDRARRSSSGGATVGGEGAPGPSAPMGATAMQDERKRRMGRNRNTIMQDRFGG